MTASGVLPTYQRFVNGVPVPFSRKSFRPREKYVILLVFITFGLVCFGTFFFLPEFKGSKSTADSVYKVYDKIKRAGPELLIPPPPHLEDEKDTPKLVRHDDDSQIDPHVIDDRAKLRAKIEQDEQLKVLERPDMNLNRKTSSTTKSNVVKPLEETLVREIDGNGMVQDSNAIITIPPAMSDHYPKIIGGEDTDTETRERRNKVKENVTANKIMVKKSEPCDSNVHYPITLSLNFTDHGNSQLADLLLITPVPFDDNLGSYFELSYMVGERLVRVFGSRQKNLCKVLNRYFGEVWYNVAKQINVQPRKCPIPKGRYELHGFDPMMEKFAVAIPNGILKLLVKLIDNRNQNIMLCKIFTSESTEN